jgi:3-methyladenine DNA glycosylase/8-oxoguanine DNA glycosylase
MARTPAVDVAKALRKADPALRDVIARHGPPPARRATAIHLRFATLASAILHQQLAGAAAAAILRRVVECVGEPITPEGLVRAGDDALAACGVSGPKRRSLFDLAAKTLDGTVDFAALSRRSDEQIAEVLTEVRGVGPWTAHMFCLFTLGRPDVWPIGDYGVRAGWTLLHDGGDVIGARDLEPLGEPFRPHRSAVAWYCWRAVEDARSSPQPT